MTASMQNILNDLRSGKMIVLVDDESRENEGDLVLAAEMVTPEALNFMLKHARGFICLPVSDAVAEQFELHPMVDRNECPFETPFTVTIDAREGITTGVSVYDRVVTIRKLLDQDARPDDFVRPGHVFPLRAHPGGVEKRHGHTEGSVELVTLAGMKRAAVISEIMNEDGSMAKGEELEQFACTHGFNICTIAQILEFVLEDSEQFAEPSRQVGDG